MRKRISARAICLVVAVAILAGALTVSAINGSPYENLKNAVFNALFYENVTAEGNFVLRIDGHEHVMVWFRDYIGDESRLSRSAEAFNPLYFDNIPTRPEYISYETHGLIFDAISGISAQHDRQWYRVRRDSNPYGSSTLGYEIFGASGRNSNQVRLVELLIDLVVGDLRNNMTISPHGDGMRRITGAITESQLPEIARVAIAIALEEQMRLRGLDAGQFTRDDFNHILEIPIRHLTVNRISGCADIDSDGNLLFINARIHVTIENIFGDIHEIEANACLNFFDIGTTAPDSLFPHADLGIFAEFFESDIPTWMFSARSSSWWALYFTLDDRGNIDLNSISSTPGFQPLDIREIIDSWILHSPEQAEAAR